jgi:hypothetical protein
MLLQTNSYIVPKDKRSEHARLLRRFRQTLMRLGADHFEVYEQVGANWASSEATGRFVQIMRFRDRKHQQEVQAGERQDPVAQQLIQEFCALINFPYQQQQGLFAVGFYTSALPDAPSRTAPRANQGQTAPGAQPGAQPGAAQSSDPAARDFAPSPADSATPQAAVDAPLDLPQTNRADEGVEGSSMLDFAGLAQTADAPAPLRLTSPADEIIESEVVPADDESGPAALPAPDAVENAENGEHAGSFSDRSDAMLELDLPDAGDEVLTDADREAVLGELTGDDASDADARRQKADGR